MEYLTQIIAMVAILLFIGAILWNILAYVSVSPTMREIKRIQKLTRQSQKRQRRRDNKELQKKREDAMLRRAMIELSLVTKIEDDFWNQAWTT